MKLFPHNTKPVCIFLTIMMLSVTVPYQPVLAAMIGTESVMDSVRGKQARDEINNLLLREDVQSALKAQGIDPLEAKARIDSLSDAEVTKIADQIDKIPAGSGAFEVSSSAFITPAIIVGAAIILIAIIIIIYLATSD
jgi:hypothetical protein